MGYANGKTWFAIGGLPGETAQVRVLREKARWGEGVVETITTPSSRRGAAAEAHFMACAPWQGVEHTYQLELKRQMLMAALGRPELGLKVAELVAAEQTMGYRNKLEFWLRRDSLGQLGLWLHERGSAMEWASAANGCDLGLPQLNRAARKVVEYLQASSLTQARLVMRTSGNSDGVVAILEVAERPPRPSWDDILGVDLVGLVVLRVSQYAPRIVWQGGILDLSETLMGTSVAYSWDAFFQVNVPVFERALPRLAQGVRSTDRVVDLYGGSGAIGVPLARLAREVLGVEVAPQAVECANRNAERNGLGNYQSVAVAVAQLDQKLLVGADIIVVDPPRAGLQPEVVDVLLASAPREIRYLSCNPVTQARDLMALSAAYSCSDVTGFDFYPGTLHVESFVVLTRKV